MSDMENSQGIQSKEGQAADEGLDEFDTVAAEILAPDPEPTAVNADGSDEDRETPQPAKELPSGSEPEAHATDPSVGTAPTEDAQSIDVWANAPAELRAAHEAALSELQKKQQRIVGNLSTRDRELARLRAELQRAAPVQPEPVPANKPSAEGGALKPNLSAIAEEFPEFAPLVAELQETKQKLAALEAPVSEMGQAKADSIHAEQLTIFTDAHPDWQSYVNDPRYAAWLVEQPKAVQDAAQRSINVEDGHEAAWLLGQFKASIGAKPAAPSLPEAKPQPDPKRARQLAAGRDGGGASPAVETGLPDDFDAAASALSVQREQQAKRQTQGRFAQ